MTTDASKPPSTRHAFLWLFLFLNFVFMLTSSGRVRVTDEVMAVLQTESLVERGSTAVPQAVEAKIYYGKYDRAGRPQSANAPGQALLAIPWYLAGQYILLRLPGIPAGARAIASDFAVVSSNATFSALLAAVFFLILVNSGTSLRSALLAALVVAFATPVFTYSAWYFSEPLGALALLIAVAALLANCGSSLTTQACAIGGIALGSALWIRPTYVIFVPLLLLAIFLTWDRPLATRCATIVALIVGLFGFASLMRNSILYGNLFDFGYPEMAEGGRRLNSFQNPLLAGLGAFLFSPGKSIFLFAPPILAGIWAWSRVWRINRGLAFLMISVPVVSLLFYARYSQYEGGYSFGPRYMYSGIILLCLGVGLVLDDGPKTPRYLVHLLFLLGLGVNMIGLATSPLEDMATGKYYDAQFNYRLDYNPLAGQFDLLTKYLASSQPAPIGRGWDRWFVFLFKAGVSKTTLTFIALSILAGALVSGWKLLRLWQSLPSKASAT